MVTDVLDPQEEIMSDGGYDIETLMRRYGNDVLRTAYSYVQDKSAAEDLFQESFIKIYQNLSNFRGESSIKTWMIRITINVCKDYLKSAYSRHVVPTGEFAEDALVSESDYDEIEKEETAKEVKDAVMKLPEELRELVFLVYYREMGLNEAASILCIPLGTAKSRLSRAREKLKNLLKGGM